jgi:hypothetical protein
LLQEFVGRSFTRDSRTISALPCEWVVVVNPAKGLLRAHTADGGSQGADDRIYGPPRHISGRRSKSTKGFSSFGWGGSSRRVGATIRSTPAFLCACYSTGAPTGPVAPTSISLVYWLSCFSGPCEFCFNGDIKLIPTHGSSDPWFRLRDQRQAYVVACPPLKSDLPWVGITPADILCRLRSGGRHRQLRWDRARTDVLRPSPCPRLPDDARALLVPHQPRPVAPAAGDVKASRPFAV